MQEIKRTQPFSENLENVSLKAFSEYVHPVLKPSVCSNCHNSEASGGKKQSPHFADPTPLTSFDAIIKNEKVYLDNVPQSRIVQKKHNCGNTKECDAIAKKFQDAITKWANKVAASIVGKNDGKLVTAEFNINVGGLNYEIGSLISKDLAGGKVTLGMEASPLENAGKGYTLANIKIVSHETNIFIKGMRPLVNGTPDDSLDRVSNCAVKSPTGAVLDGSMIVAVDDVKATNLLSFQFEELRVAKDDDNLCDGDGKVGGGKGNTETINEQESNDPLANKRQEFETTIKGIIQMNCSREGCHDGVYQQAYHTNFQTTWNTRQLIYGSVFSGGMPPNTPDFPQKNTLLQWLTVSP